MWAALWPPRRHGGGHAGHPLVVNDSTVLESNFFYTTPKYEDGPAYPLTLAQDEYFLLCDFGRAPRDSRYFGPVKTSEIKGKVITVIRRSGL